MINKVDCVMLECDNCKDTYESTSGYSIFPDDSTLKELATDDGWEMRYGYVMIIDRSDSTGNIFCLITKGYHRVYINSGTFSRMFDGKWIHQQNSHSFNWVLTQKSLDIEINP